LISAPPGQTDCNVVKGAASLGAQAAAMPS
jgi:hypothetical protein